MAQPDERNEKLPLPQAVGFLLDECRMVLPGIQALFGFQLIAVFNEGFSKKLSPDDQLLHLSAIVLIALAIALIMAPAAYHRHTPEQVTGSFIRVSTHLLLWSMIPLCLGICIDVFLIADIVLDRALAALIAVLLFSVFVFLWFLLPRVARLRRIASELG